MKRASLKMLPLLAVLLGLPATAEYVSNASGLLAGYRVADPDQSWVTWVVPDADDSGPLVMSLAMSMLRSFAPMPGQSTVSRNACICFAAETGLVVL
ncbi:MAG: hypothetical protein ABR538_11730 [Candidatus Binatia bacterium]